MLNDLLLTVVEKYPKLLMWCIAGLNMDTAEELQVANYGIGGHYEPHFDFARVSCKVKLSYSYITCTVIYTNIIVYLNIHILYCILLELYLWFEVWNNNVSKELVAFI